jgi:streptogramin lyase
MGPNGDLYIVDEARSEIFERLPDGRFRVVAGTGTGGFSGDGGPAVDADLGGPLGMVTGTNGVVYFADSRNDRVRALLPNGTITTVAGNGQPAAGWEGTPVIGPTALQTAIGTTEAVTMGPDGSLYIAASNAVLKLTDGQLSTVADDQNFLGVDQRFPGASSCDPDGLAFDGSGDLFMTCSDTNDLLEETARGVFVYRGILRPHDASAALASSPDGTVIGLWQSDMYRFTPTSQEVITDFDTVPGVGDFWPQGVAVASDGTIYLDQDGVGGIGPPSIVAYSPTGKVSALWAHTEAPTTRSSAVA